MLKNSLKYLVISSLIFYFGNFSYIFAVETPAQNPSDSTTSTDAAPAVSNTNADNTQSIQSMVQKIQNLKNVLYDNAKNLKTRGKDINDTDYLSIYRIAVNTKNDLRTNYMALAQLGYDQNDWQKNYNEAKNLVDNISTELVSIKNNDYVLKMVDAENTEINWSDYQVDKTASPDEIKRQEAAIANKITQQQAATTAETAKKIVSTDPDAKSKAFIKECEDKKIFGNSWLSTPMCEMLDLVNSIIQGMLDQLNTFSTLLIDRIPK